MTDQFDYMKLLDDAKKELKAPQKEEERFKVPDVESFIEGKSTIFRNFNAIVGVIAREAEHLQAHLVKEIGAPGHIDESGRLVLKARVIQADLQKKVNGYFETYVLCSECGRPDTHLIKDSRTLIVVCDACGGRRPVHVKKGVKHEEKSQKLQVGDIVEVTVQDISHRGDGMVRQGPYVIFVPGTAKGDRVKIRIEHVSNSNYVQTKVVKE